MELCVRAALRAKYIQLWKISCKTIQKTLLSRRLALDSHNSPAPRPKYIQLCAKQSFKIPSTPQNNRQQSFEKHHIIIFTLISIQSSCVRLPFVDHNSVALSQEREGRREKESSVAICLRSFSR